MAVGCFNAAAAMFRLSLDLATKDLLPGEGVKDFDYSTRRFLARRLKWLFDNKKLPEALRELSSVVKDELQATLAPTTGRSTRQPLKT